jgi:hypothetical protein
MEFHIKEAGNRTILLIKIIGKEDSDGWLEAQKVFEENGIKAQFNFSMMLNDLHSFVDQLKIFNEKLKGQAAFSNIEDNVQLTFTTTGLGDVSIKVNLRHTLNPELQLSYVINSDQTFLKPLLLECTDIIKQYGNN